MNFEVYGGFPVTEKGANTEFWREVDTRGKGLSQACGCYVFAIRNGNNFRARYIGKTEKNTFRGRFVDHAGRLRTLSKETGEIQIFLIPALTRTGRFMRPRRKGCPEIDYLETMFIGMALRRNPDLTNVQITTMLRSMHVSGVINAGRGQPTRAAKFLKNALGI